MNPYEYRISFRISHPTEDLASISSELDKIEGFEAQRVLKVGEPRQTPKGRSAEGRYPESSCSFHFFNSEIQTSTQVSLSDAIESIVERLEPHKTILDKIAVTGGRSSFFIGWFIDANSGNTFTAELLQKLANLSIALEVDVYPGKSTSK